MSLVTLGLDAQLAIAALAVLLAMLPGPHRGRRAGPAVAGLSAAAVLTALAVLSGDRGGIRIPVALPWPAMAFEPDRLGAIFMLLAGGVGLLVSVYGIGYAHGPAGSRSGWCALAVFLLGLQLVPAAADASSFLLAWEVMALGSTALVLSDHADRAAVRSAALWYAVMTHLSFLALLAGVALLARHGHGYGLTWADLATTRPDSWAGALAFGLFLLGFGAKAGLVPVHVWLPRAHPEAPSHVSAAMSAGMVSMGIYGLLLVTTRLLPGGPPWWGALLIGIGSTSAVYGILQASVASDLKRLLAYSTTENVGLVAIAIGAAVLLQSEGSRPAGEAALLAALLLTLSHAAFKVTLFLAAGAVVHATGERDLDRLGGLATRMPWTAAAFGISALGAAALPVSAGFAAEWTLLQGLIHGARPGQTLVALFMPLAVTAVALTAGLALLTFVKAYGIAFLARARSAEAEVAVEVPWSMRAAMLAGAAAVLGLGLAPGALASLMVSVHGSGGQTGGAIGTGFGGVRLSGLNSSLNPAALALAAALIACLVAAASARQARLHPARNSELVWGCGGGPGGPRMQYTATSYAEPLMRVFDDALRPTRDVVVTHAQESAYLIEQVTFRQRVEDIVETRLYRPAFARADRLGERSRGLHNGSVHRYLAYSFAALVIVLVAVSV